MPGCIGKIRGSTQCYTPALRKLDVPDNRSKIAVAQRPGNQDDIATGAMQGRREARPEGMDRQFPPQPRDGFPSLKAGMRLSGVQSMSWNAPREQLFPFAIGLVLAEPA